MIIEKYEALINIDTDYRFDIRVGDDNTLICNTGTVTVYGSSKTETINKIIETICNAYVTWAKCWNREVNGKRYCPDWEDMKTDLLSLLTEYYSDQPYWCVIGSNGSIKVSLNKVSDKPKWYSEDKYGSLMVFENKVQAEIMVQKLNAGWPQNGPFRVVCMVEIKE